MLLEGNALFALKCSLEDSTFQFKFQLFRCYACPSAWTKETLFLFSFSQKTSLTVDENFKVKINPHLQETHGKICTNVFLLVWESVCVKFGTLLRMHSTYPVIPYKPWYHLPPKMKRERLGNTPRLDMSGAGCFNKCNNETTQPRWFYLSLFNTFLLWQTTKFWGC